MLYYGLLLFFFLEYVRPTSFMPGLAALHLNSIVPIAVAVGALLSGGRITNGQVWRESNTKVFVSLLGLIMISGMFARVHIYAFSVMEVVIGYGLIYWVIAKQVTDLKRIKGVFATLVVVHITVAALSPDVITKPEVRNYIASGSFLGDGNDFALSINIVIPLCLFLLLDASTVRQKLMYGAALLFLVLCVIGTSSRAGTLGLASVGLYYWVKSDKKLLSAIGVAAIVGMVFVVAPPTYFARMNTIETYEEDGSAQGRIRAWNSSVRMALDNPLLGVGPGQFPTAYGMDYRPEGFGRTQIAWHTAHSIYFLILGELGFPGIILLLLFIGMNLIANRRVQCEIERSNDESKARNARLLTCVSASLIAYAVNGAFLSAVYYPHMYVLGGLIVAARFLVRSEELYGMVAAKGSSSLPSSVSLSVR